MCKCYIAQESERRWIQFCPMHAAALELLEAAHKAILDGYDTPDFALTAAIAKATKE